MKIIPLLVTFIVTILAKKKHSTPQFKANKPPNQVDLALETALIFEPEDAKFDLSLIRTFRNYLDQLQYMIVKKSDTALRSKDRAYLLKEFLRDLGKSLLEYKDENIKSLSVALDSIIEDYYPPGTVFHKIVFDPRLKAYIKNTVKEWSERHPKEIKNDIQSLFGEATYNNTFINLIDTVNTFFDDEDTKTFRKFTKKFKKFPKTSMKLNKLVEETLGFIIFDKYESLNFTQKNSLVEQLSKVSDYVSVRFRNKAVDPETTFRYKRTHENDTIGLKEEDLKTIGKPSNEFSESERETIVDPDNSLEKITKNSQENYKMNELGDHHEIVFNKNVEINVRHSPDNATVASKLPNTTSIGAVDAKTVATILKT